MPDTKRPKKEEAAADDAEEDQAAAVADDEQDAGAVGDLSGAAAEEAYDYDAEENEFLTALADVQEKLIEVNDEASDKVLQVEQEYNLKRQPIYKERNEIIRQMPDFWHEVFRGHDTLRQLITTEDEEGLMHLQEVLVEDNADIKSGFKIVLIFLANKFFQNTQLEKHIRYQEDGSFEVSGIGPKWHPGESLTETAVYENGKPTGAKRKRGVLSFFSWLEGDMPKDTELEIAEIIKEQIWPNPLAYYRNPGAQTSDEGPIELLEDDEEYEEGDEAVEYDEHGNPIEYLEIAEGEEYREEDFYEEPPGKGVYLEGDPGFDGEEEEEGAEGTEEEPARGAGTAGEGTAAAAAHS